MMLIFQNILLWRKKNDIFFNFEHISFRMQNFEEIGEIFPAN